MQIIWSPGALAQLVEIRAYIEQDRPDVATPVAERIVAAIDQLAVQPHMGRPGRTAGTRELVIPGTPYVVPYRVQDNRVRVLGVFHGAQRWPDRF